MELRSAASSSPPSFSLDAFFESHEGHDALEEPRAHQQLHQGPALRSLQLSEAQEELPDKGLAFFSTGSGAGPRIALMNFLSIKKDDKKRPNTYNTIIY